jgi:hypothetical protein
MNKLEEVGQHLPELIQQATEVGLAYFKLKGYNIRLKNNAYVKKVIFPTYFSNDFDEFTLEVEFGCGCCPGEVEEFDFPISSLWNLEEFLILAKLRGDFDGR